MRFAVFGTGFWSHFQIPAWKEAAGLVPVAAYNRTLSRAELVCQKFGIPAWYDDPEKLLAEVPLDFIDIITEIGGHAPLVEMAARYRVPVICQKPMAPDLATAEHMVEVCRSAGVPFFIHENWRWQAPIRAVKEILRTGEIGEVFRARIEMISGFPVFDNQPALKQLDQFILTDLGSHTLDTARFLFGEATSLVCHTRRIHQDIRGEDVASVLLEMGSGTIVNVHMAYAGNPIEHDHFPQTWLFIEGTQGTIELGPDYWVRVTTRAGTLARRVPPPRYAWADPVYDVVHASIVPCNADLLRGLRGQGCETTAEDNLRTVRLVFGCYDSAANGTVIHLPG